HLDADPLRRASEAIGGQIAAALDLRPPARMCSGFAVASPAMHRSTNNSTRKPCASISASITPSGASARRRSARRRSLRSRCARDGIGRPVLIRTLLYGDYDRWDVCVWMIPRPLEDLSPPLAGLSLPRDAPNRLVVFVSAIS